MMIVIEWIFFFFFAYSISFLSLLKVSGVASHFRSDLRLAYEPLEPFANVGAAGAKQPWAQVGAEGDKHISEQQLGFSWSPSSHSQRGEAGSGPDGDGGGEVCEAGRAVPALANPLQYGSLLICHGTYLPYV